MENGVGQICLLVDGGWSKRSYGHNYNAAFGVVSKIMYTLSILINEISL